MDKEKLENFAKMLILDRTDSDDFERKSLFYLIASDDDLTKRVKKIYDFKNKIVNFKYIENTKEIGKLSESSKQLLMLGANLYNGYITNTSDVSVMGIIYTLDDRQRQIFIEALNIRLGYKKIGILDIL